MKTKYHHGDLKAELIKTGLKMIQENGIEKENYFNYGIRDNVMHTLGVGTARNMKSVITGIFFRHCG